MADTGLEPAAPCLSGGKRLPTEPCARSRFARRLSHKPRRTGFRCDACQRCDPPEVKSVGMDARIPLGRRTRARFGRPKTQLCDFQRPYLCATASARRSSDDWLRRTGFRADDVGTHELRLTLEFQFNGCNPGHSCFTTAHILRRTRGDQLMHVGDRPWKCASYTAGACDSLAYREFLISNELGGAGCDGRRRNPAGERSSAGRDRHQRDRLALSLRRATDPERVSVLG
jgi:hypothetical protein